MYVINGKENANMVEDKYTTLELDTLLLDNNEQLTNYAVIGPDEIDMKLLTKWSSMITLHQALIKNYKIRNWRFCIDAIEQLQGNIDPFMDSFYDILAERVLGFEKAKHENAEFPLVRVS